MVMVTGASGHLGGTLVRDLLARGGAGRVLIQGDAPTPGLQGLDVEVARGDVRDPAALDAAFHEGRRLYRYVHRALPERRGGAAPGRTVAPGRRAPRRGTRRGRGRRAGSGRPRRRAPRRSRRRRAAPLSGRRSRRMRSSTRSPARSRPPPTPACARGRAELARRWRAWPTGDDAWLGREVVEALLDAPWPGNTRELRAVVARMVERDLDRPTCAVPRLASPTAEPPSAPEVAAPAAPSPPPTDEARPSTGVALRFHVSRDEEHVEMTVTRGDRSFTPRPRAHTYTLLTLARARVADEQAGELPPEERGWIHRDELCRQLRLDPNLLLTHLLRARRRLADADMPGADDLFERRLDAGQLRLGHADIAIVQS